MEADEERVNVRILIENFYQRDCRRRLEDNSLVPAMSKQSSGNTKLTSLTLE